MIEVINLKQGNMSVKEYSLKFTKLVRFSPSMVADNRSRMSKFVFGVAVSVVKE